MESRTLALEALSRSNLYGLLARITRTEVDAELLAEFRKPEVMEALCEVGVDLSLALVSLDDKELLEQLSVAYTHLFILTVNPHESVQRGEGQLWGNHTVAADLFMQEIGLAMAQEKSLLPDHIALELEVMQHLTTEEAACWEAGDEVRAQEFQDLQRRYMGEHLGTWCLEFFGSAERLASHDFYKQMAMLGRNFLYSEQQALAK